MKNRNIVIILIILISLLTACAKPAENIEPANDLLIPEPANAYALDKETEIETVAPTEAHKPYEEGYKVVPGREVYIGENEFMTRINYIYNNIELFENSSIIVEGMYGLYYSWDETFSFPMVYRNGPADYGDDQYIGFYLANLKEGECHLNDWIRVRGRPYMYEHKDSEGEIAKYMFLSVEKCEVLSLRERKAEMVND